MATNETFAKTVYVPSDAGESFHYYDTHPTNEDLMSESAAQSQLIFYLLKVLECLYQAEGWFVVSNLNIYRERRRNEDEHQPWLTLDHTTCGWSSTSSEGASL